MTICGGENQFQVSKCSLQPLQSDRWLWDESSVKLFLQELNAVIVAFRFNRSERRRFNRWRSAGVVGVESGRSRGRKGVLSGYRYLGMDSWDVYVKEGRPETRLT